MSFELFQLAHEEPRVWIPPVHGRAADHHATIAVFANDPFVLEDPYPRTFQDTRDEGAPIGVADREPYAQRSLERGQELAEGGHRLLVALRIPCL